ncbi:hypothetical protein TNIN_480411 [Trichonephila inaurata madagascariensis]|uniref:Uncharacterized protein n=1 Tax=Trichonephila inaurata madagascariensis TaxID=2747483 RepID=A0A8X6MA43_9ARAC|nr:hypothetical protein TNIN_480411 [Trichonephila inaurata madagascariensis]
MMVSILAPNKDREQVLRVFCDETESGMFLSALRKPPGGSVGVYLKGSKNSPGNWFSNTISAQDHWGPPIPLATHRTTGATLSILYGTPNSVEGDEDVQPYHSKGVVGVVQISLFPYICFRM